MRNIRGSTAKTQAEILRENGVDNIYGLEKTHTLDDALRRFRNEPGILHIAADFRVFIDLEVDLRDIGKEQQITDAVDKCEGRRITVKTLLIARETRKKGKPLIRLDTHAAQIRYANRMLASERAWKNDKRKASRIGQKGGKKRGTNWRDRFEARVDPAVRRRLIGCIGKTLTQKDVAQILGISLMALRTHFLNRNE